MFVGSRHRFGIKRKLVKHIKNFKNKHVNSRYMALKIKQISIAIVLMLVLILLLVSSCTVPIKPTNEVNPAIKIEQGQDKNLPLKTPAELQKEKEEYLLDQEILKDAIANLDSGSCEIMKNELLQETCYANLADLTGSIELCENIADPGTKEGCILVVSTNTLNADACSKITNREKSNICLKDIAINKSSSDLCAKVNEEALADECYLTIGVANKNAELCEKIALAEKKITCYSTIGVATESIPTCEKIKSKSNPFARDICIGKIAVNTKNLTLCNELKWNDTKNTCIGFTNDAISKSNSSK